MRARRTLIMVLVLCLCLTVLPAVTMRAEAAALSQSQFDTRLSSAKTAYPTGSQREEWSINGTVVGWQCHGYGRWLSWYVWGVDFANGNGAGWTLLKSSSSSSYINSLAPGDVVRFRRISSSGVLRTWNHTIFITSIIGDNIYYTDCNSDGACTIKWEQCVSKSTLDSWLKLPLYGSEAASYGYIAHYTSNTLSGGTVSCNCSTSYAGTYVCTTSSLNLTIRSGHGVSYSAIGSIPSGATVTVTKASGTSSSDWAHVTYNGISGYASMEYLQKQGSGHAETPTIHWWVSDSEYGDAVDTFRAGNRYYFCYRLYDKVTGKDWDEVVTADYTVKLTFYNPDGSVKYTNQNIFDYDQSWISSFFSEAGTYQIGVVVDGAYSFTGTRSLTVVENPIQVHSSINELSLSLGELESQTFYAWVSGYYSGNWVLSYGRSNTNVRCEWGDWTDDDLAPLTITANKKGTTTVTISVKDKTSGAVLDSMTVVIAVGAKEYTVSYNANGGKGAPASQTKYHNTTLTLSSTAPTRSGYTFMGWSTSSTATSATYQPGGSFTLNANTTMYAVWEKGCEDGNHKFVYDVTKRPTSASKGMLAGECGYCGATVSVVLPSLNTDDYNYKITKEATCTTAGTGRYVWKLTTYGQYYFDETIPEPGHSYDYKATKDPTTSATGLLTGFCAECSETTTVILPKLNTTDYTYKLKSAANCTENGTEQYIWNTTAYGRFKFVVEIPALGHKVSDGVCTVCNQVPVKITAQPENQAVKTGETVKFTISATGSGLTYQWQYRTSSKGSWKNVSASSGKTAAYSVKTEARHHGYQYRCRISDAYGYRMYSKTVTLNVLGIKTQPSSKTVVSGKTTKFTVSAVGKGLTYQWQYRTSSSGSWKNVSATSGKTAAYSLKTAARHHGYQYRCRITDSSGNKVYTKTVSLYVLGIKTQPASKTVKVGATAKFTVSAVGKGLTYQWQYRTSSSGSWKNVTVSSGKKATYSLTATSRHNGYQYRCRIKDSAGNVIYSNVVKLTVKK